MCVIETERAKVIHTHAYNYKSIYLESSWKLVEIEANYDILYAYIAEYEAK